jgi:phosphoribosylformylglycinamidine synthase
MDLYKALNISDYEYDQIKSRLTREPNEVETYLFSAMWSEHCSYKHSRKYLANLPKAGSIGAEENAGGIQIGDQVVVFKVESHNHPSAIEPFQGAATGIGGIIRDIIAVGARPIALLDSLKFGNIKDPNVKHLLDGVVKGISAYGNSIGVPTVAGEIAFDDSYSSSPLVNVMAVGIAHKNDIKTAQAKPGGIVVLIGSHTGRDGIHGASFASKELSDKSREDRPSVQVGDPFMEKILIEATLEILQLPEIICCQDCGAAGLLSSTSEMSFKGNCGIDLYLEKVHLRENGMLPWEIMLSESQERMVFEVTEDGLDKLLAIAKKYDIPASVIGETTDNGLYNLFWHGENVASLPAETLCEGPKYTLTDEEPEYINEYKNKILSTTIRHAELVSATTLSAKNEPYNDGVLLSASHNLEIPNAVDSTLPRNSRFARKQEELQVRDDISQSIKKIVADPSFASKRWVFRQYDHMVGNRTSIKPGQPGASGIWSIENAGILGLTIDSNGKQVFLDPYNGSINTVWEAFRNLVSCGFEPKGITNCLNYGNPEKDEVAYQLVKSIKGMSKACIDMKIPVVSGNVSLYNESPTRRVYPTPTIGMVGYADKFENLIANSFNKGETIFLIGKQIDDNSNIGGSLYQMSLYNFLGGKIDEADTELELQLKELISKLRDKQVLNACVDVSEGGLFGALFEGLMTNNCGFTGNLINISNNEIALFGEITGRYLISTNHPDDMRSVIEQSKIPYNELGICNNTNHIEFNGYKIDSKELIELYENSLESEMER